MALCQLVGCTPVGRVAAERRISYCRTCPACCGPSAATSPARSRARWTGCTRRWPLNRVRLAGCRRWARAGLPPTPAAGSQQRLCSGGGVAASRKRASPAQAPLWKRCAPPGPHHARSTAAAARRAEGERGLALVAPSVTTALAPLPAYDRGPGRFTGALGEALAWVCVQEQAWGSDWRLGQLRRGAFGRAAALLLLQPHPPSSLSFPGLSSPPTHPSTRPPTHRPLPQATTTSSAPPWPGCTSG